jgi:hypothetical protein
MTPKYRWKLTIGNDVYDVQPVYKDELALNYEKETQQRFFRAKLSSKIDFVARDADVIIAAPFETDFLLDIELSSDYGLTWQTYYHCHFHKTDCTINFDDRKVSVQPEAIDRYNDVLAGLDKEFNLIELAPAIQPIGLTKRPMFQLYTVGENICSCLCGGQAFEQDMFDTSESRVRECGFGGINAGWEFNFQNPPVEGFGSPFIGFFNGAGSEFWATDTTYYLTYFEWSEPIVGSRYIQNHNGIRVVQTSTGTTLWEFDQYKVTLWENDYNDIPAELTFSGDPQLTAYKTEYGMYGRLVLDRNEVQGWTVSELRSDDVVSNNRNYHYSLPFTDFNIQQSSRTSVEPTKWGRNDAGQYFLPPDDIREWYPVGRSQWVNTSVWMMWTVDMGNIEVAGRKPFTLKDAFPIWSVIKVLLAKVAPDVTHEGTAAYSDFLYGTAKSQFDRDTRLFIAPKSNIIVGEYQEPAMKAPTTLGNILKMLRDMYGCYWFVDEQNRLRIEHIRWFKNGGSYSGEPVIGIDLTNSINIRNEKDWAFDTSEVKFNKEEMPERYQYEWMDDSTDVFNGNPVNILSTFVHKGKVEEVTISGFTSDVDYMLLAPDMCSKDGFAIMAARASGNDYVVDIVNTGFDQWTKSIQNPYLAMRWLIPSYLTYDMPSWNIEIGDVQQTASGIQRNRQQTISFPADVDMDMMQLVKTHIGNGEIDKAEVNLSSRQAKVQLKYDTYDRE